MPSNDRIGASGLPAQRRSADPAPQPQGFPSHDRDRVRVLVAAAQNGHAEAFGQLYEMYCDEVFRFAYHRTSSVTAAEDVTSETFIRALRSIGSFSWRGDGAEFGGWLITIARNHIADLYRSARFSREYYSDQVDLLAEEPVDSAEREMLNRLDDSVVRDAIASLKSADQRQCIRLRFLNQLSVAETAAAMGRGAGAIKALQFRAMKSLVENEKLAEWVNTGG